MMNKNPQTSLYNLKTPYIYTHSLFEMSLSLVSSNLVPRHLLLNYAHDSHFCPRSNRSNIKVLNCGTLFLQQFWDCKIRHFITAANKTTLEESTLAALMQTKPKWPLLAPELIFALQHSRSLVTQVDLKSSKCAAFPLCFDWLSAV